MGKSTVYPPYVSYAMESGWRIHGSVNGQFDPLKVKVTEGRGGEGTKKKFLGSQVDFLQGRAIIFFGFCWENAVRCCAERGDTFFMAENEGRGGGRP